MARKGPAPKADAIRRNHRPELTVVLPSDPPPPRRQWLKATRDGWDAFWRTPQAGAVDEASHPALVRLFDLRDEVARLRKAIGNKRIVQGSQGQARAHPAYSVLKSMLEEVRQLEDRFAMNPAQAVRLGLRVQEAQRRLVDAFEWDSGGSDDPVD